ncbi:hypothetical protein [Hymenobacter armeniacus]|uniref:DUF1440 domain-containing protein n=1 Tax=Hymenobacter armeniacus TaxID=2771358 RepID=A0ABR8K0X9_9BACT|nr:hypothetical protein [Hymenobacter armeniacus]MBD2724727.1 hypothetical protein [Hymenobacter armeniacus]
METSLLPSPAARRTGWVAAALLTGLLAGTLDIAAACTQYVLLAHKPPVNVLRFVASGLFGPAALAGGAGMALAGLVFHYGIACAWALVLYWLYPRWSLLRQLPPLLVGLLYGAVVWAIMNLLVVPASRIPPRPFNLPSAAMAMGILMACIGLPIAWRAARYYGRRP